MSMNLITILQTGAVFGAYSLMVLVLPALLFGNKLRGFRLMERFFIYLTIGNFYMMNLVFLLQLLHISNRATLIAGTVLPAMVVLVRFRALSVVDVLRTQWVYFVRFTQGRVGARTLAGNVFGWLGERCRAAGRWIWVQMRQSWLEWIAVAAVTALLFWQYGSNLLVSYGYGVSDIIVHNYWINAMGEGKIFVAGIYPFGFHCVIYYLHCVFGIDTYVLLRLFCFVQVLYLHMVLLAFIRLNCRTRYSVYPGVVLFVAGSFFAPNNYSRYYSSLPQEFGVLFILPAIWFLLDFLNIRREEVKGNRRALGKLLLFALSFSMTLAVHFYGTMIAGLFCVAVAAAYLNRIFRKEYFWRILAAGILSIFLAVLPMGVAFIGGTPLQGSLEWGMNVITGGSGEEDNGEDTGKNKANSAEDSGGPDGNQTEGLQPDLPQEHNRQEQIKEPQDQENNLSGQDYRPEASGWPDEWRGDAIRVRLQELLKSPFVRLARIKEQIQYALTDNIFDEYQESLARLTIWIVGILFVAGLFVIARTGSGYGRGLTASGIFILMLLLLLSADRLGLPRFMDANRAGVYLSYMLPLLWALGLDGILTLLFGWIWKGKAADLASLAALAALCLVLFLNGLYREPLRMEAGQTNGAIACLTRIIRENQDKTWTICSANDEMQMGADHGWHFETIDLLRRMEGNNWKSLLHIPTSKIYFFIEKIPLLYYSEDPEWTQRLSVSAEGASGELPSGGGLGVYVGKNRWIVMSRMYEWAQEFSKLYTNEMKVYYEDEEFICYSLEQNEYRLYNLAINYGYNTRRISLTGMEH